jgi:arsenate reductase
MDRKTKVLFLSTGNSARSQMAEGFLRAYAGDRFTAVIAGIQSAGLDPTASEVMREIGIDISRQRSKNLPASFKEHYGYVITLSDKAREHFPAVSVHAPSPALEH